VPARTAVLLSPSSGSQAAAIQVGPTLENAFRFETTRPALVRVPVQSGSAPNSALDPAPGKMSFPQSRFKRPLSRKSHQDPAGGPKGKLFLHADARPNSLHVAISA